MNKKIISLVTFCFILFCFVISTEAYGHGSKKHDKVSEKAHLILLNEDELSLTDEQVAQIRIIKADAMKDSIRKEAEIDVIKVDIKSHLWEDEIDTAAVDVLIDKKYDLKKAKAKASVKSLADLKNVLTEEQKDTLRSLCRNKRKEKSAEKCETKCPPVKELQGKTKK